jgi:hypothetical protein
VWFMMYLFQSRRKLFQPAAEGPYIDNDLNLLGIGEVWKLAYLDAGFPSLINSISKWIFESRRETKWRELFVSINHSRKILVRWRSTFVRIVRMKEWMLWKPESGDLGLWKDDDRRTLSPRNRWIQLKRFVADRQELCELTDDNRL